MSLASTEIKLCKEIKNDLNIQNMNDLSPLTLMTKVGNFFKRDGSKSEEKTKVLANPVEKVYFNSKQEFYYNRFFFLTKFKKKFIKVCFL